MVYVTSSGYEVGFVEDISPEEIAWRRDLARKFREYQPSIEESTARSLVTITDYSSGEWSSRNGLALLLPQLPGFSGGVLIVPETKIAFIGSLDVIVAYRLDTFEEIWEDVVFGGFWGWNRSGDVVLMSGELEMSGWDIHAGKKWSTSVEPPWTYHVKDGIVHLNVMDKLSSFPLDTGPTQ